MTTWVPDPDAALVDGSRVRIGDGPHEGTWKGYPTDVGSPYLGYIMIATGSMAVPLGCPVTVLREVQLKVETTVSIRLPVGRDDAILDDIAVYAMDRAKRRGIDALVASETLPVPATPDADR